MMRSSTPKPKPVKRKIKKSVKRRPLKVPRHALERLPDDYIVVKGSGARGGVAAARRSRVSVAPTDLGPSPVPPVSRLDRFGRPVNTGIPGLPSASDFTRIVGSGFTEAGRALNALGRAFYNYGANRFPLSAPASTVGTETGYETVQEDIESDVEFFNAEGPPLSPPPPAAPAEPSAPPAPDVPVPGTNSSDMEDIVDIRLEIERAENELARSRTAAQLRRLQTRILDLEQQLEDAQEVLNPERASASTQTLADGEVEALQAQIRNLQDDVLRSMRTVAVAYPEPILRPETRDTGTEMEPIRDQADNIRDLEEYIRQLTGTLMDSRDRERDLEYELAARPTTARVDELTQLLANEQDYANEVRRDLQQTRAQLSSTQQDLQNNARMLEHANLTYEQTLQEVERLQALQDQATHRPEMIERGVGPETVGTRDSATETEAVQTADARVGTVNPRMVSTPTSTNVDRQLPEAPRRPDTQRRRPNPPQGTSRPREDPYDNLNNTRPTVVRRLVYPDPSANPDNNVDMDMATAGAVARQEEFVPAVPEIEPVVEPPLQHLHAPAAPAGRGRGRVPVGQQQRNAALQGGTSSRGRNRQINRRYIGGSS
jgi:predicted  nucleic acid-binding Zn-ribbon protein